MIQSKLPRLTVAKAIFILSVLPILHACSTQSCPSAFKNLAVSVENDVAERVQTRAYPSVFQAWYPIDMEAYPLETAEQRLVAAAKHDLLWEEPLSQLGEGVDLVLGLVWNGDYHGLASMFTEASLTQARANKQRLRELNPNIVTLLEIRWRDAPMSFLPDTSS